FGPLDCSPAQRDLCHEASVSPAPQRPCSSATTPIDNYLGGFFPHWSYPPFGARSDIRDARGHRSWMSLRSSGLRLSSGNPTPSRHKGGRQERIRHFAALVDAGIAGLHDAPFGTPLRGPLGFNYTGETDGVAGQHRLDPAQFAKSRRGPPHGDLLAAGDGLRCQPLAVGNQELHADRGDVPARCSQSPEQGFASFLLIEVKA